MLRRRWSLVVLVVWTAYVWTTRIVNAWSASDESTSAKVISTVCAVALLALAAGVARVLVVARGRAFTAGEVRLVTVLAGATVVVWALRIPQILLDDRGAAFKAVHVVLGALSIALAALGWRAATRELEAAPADRAVSPAANAGR